jgi:hypothetical protein
MLLGTDQKLPRKYKFRSIETAFSFRPVSLTETERSERVGCARILQLIWNLLEILRHYLSRVPSVLDRTAGVRCLELRYCHYWLRQ